MIESLAEAVAQRGSGGFPSANSRSEPKPQGGTRSRGGRGEAACSGRSTVMRGRTWQRGLPADLRSVSGLVGGDAARLPAMTRTTVRDALHRRPGRCARGAGGERGNGRHRGGTDRRRVPACCRACCSAWRSDARFRRLLVRGLAAAGLVGAVVARPRLAFRCGGRVSGGDRRRGGDGRRGGRRGLGGPPRWRRTPSPSTMQGTLGLVCDPLGGLVEVPCVYRNATGAAMALAGIEMALAGVRFPDPGRRGDRHDGRDRTDHGRALPGDRRRWAGGDADRATACEGAAGQLKRPGM